MHFTDASGQQHSRSACLDVWGDDDEYQRMNKHQLRTSRLEPITYDERAGNDNAALGKSGLSKLDVAWDADSNTLIMLDEAEWDFGFCVADEEERSPHAEHCGDEGEEAGASTKPDCTLTSPHLPPTPHCARR
jgi:hypothetical protein